MKKITIALVILFASNAMITAQLSTIHFLRARNPINVTLTLEVSVNSEVVGRLKIGEHLIYKTDLIGNQQIDFRIGNAKNKITLNVEPGKVYYIRGEMRPTQLKMEELKEDYGKNYLNDKRNFKKYSEPYLVEHITRTQGEIVDFQAENIPEITKQTVTNITNQKRLALIIGNGNYLHGGSLPNPLNDAADMAATLKGLGFDVTLVKNADQTSLKQAIDKFGNQLNSYDIGLFYYAGHGLQSKGFNYFIPVDANLEKEAQIEFDCVRTDRLLRVMENAGSKTNIIILDACRNNPFERSWNRSAQGSGLAFMDAPSGSLIAYATSPGKIASDGTGRNGLYTSALLKYIQVPGISIEQMFKKVRESVSTQSHKDQIPWESTSLVGEFYFATHTPQ